MGTASTASSQARPLSQRQGLNLPTNRPLSCAAAAGGPCRHRGRGRPHPLPRHRRAPQTLGPDVRQAPPAGLTKDIMGRMIAYRIQEEAFGGLDRETAQFLDRLASGEKINKPSRRLKPGTVLVREYQGERHTVKVVPDGFLWQDATYSSLSTIARAITGTAWNGPRFFGLR